MGWDYALVYARAYPRMLRLTNKIHSHLYYNIPPAALLTACYYPFYTKIDVYKILFLVIVCLLVYQNVGARVYQFPDRCCIYHPVGFIPHSPSNMDLPV